MRGGLAFYLLLPVQALGHGGMPTVTNLEFPLQAGGEPWAVTSNQGLYARVDGGFRWLCEDSVEPFSGFRGAVPVGEGTGTMLFSTSLGYFRSSDGGCNFVPIAGALAGKTAGGLWPHPGRAMEVLTVTVGIAEAGGSVANDVYITEDGGETWQGAGLAVDGPVRSVVRSDADPEFVYVRHADGAARSEDGGRTFVPITLGPPELDAVAEEMFVLATHPQNALEIWAHLARFPDSYLIRSRDGGETWTTHLQIEDEPRNLVFDQAGERALVLTPFAGWQRSEDGGDTWAPTDTAVINMSCLVREPGADRLWGCGNIFFRSPWVLGSSDDFGFTWRSEFRNFVDIESSWSCPPGSQAFDGCQDFCPGGGSGPLCRDPDAGAPDQEDSGQPPDAAPADEGMPRDAGAEPRDAAPRAEEGGGGGCQQTPGAAGLFAALLVAADGLLRKRRRRLS